MSNPFGPPPHIPAYARAASSTQRLPFTPPNPPLPHPIHVPITQLLHTCTRTVSPDQPYPATALPTLLTSGLWIISLVMKIFLSGYAWRAS